MAHKQMIMTATGVQNYRTRSLTAGDPVTLSGPDARLFERLGWATPPKRRGRRVEPEAQVPADAAPDPAPDPAPEAVDERVALRDEYALKFGRKAYMGWDADTLRAKIAEGPAGE